LKPEKLVPFAMRVRPDAPECAMEHGHSFTYPLPSAFVWMLFCYDYIGLLLRSKQLECAKCVQGMATAYFAGHDAGRARQGTSVCPPAKKQTVIGVVGCFAAV
jgi:hypothetical protein